ncbi:MAG: hypothetical protein A2Z99_16900 [Treponema sp. GWB1_62_6]|nr:MAG: hypothetical protein A2Z99_16900 [Treponema sp. GWB1_62_6]OHE69729.1 MAG: hypothetical protein A2001_14430 [Treponema sp. GWC1_61_84]OHE76906.1 MAG: hypothetical protein A2413_07085 [Treponema sp. RIFOXYC1_FULL_61_9]HCM26774.1 glycerophosphodiester phosphodiesterase [Treponema sp.]
MNRVPLFPEAPRPLVFAHRGASSLAPENTMASFRKARGLGCPGLEFDVRRCASGELVVIHDGSLARTAGLDKKVEDMDLAELRAMDAGSWFSPEFAGEKIPLLDEVLDELGDEMYMDIELKTRLKKDDPLPTLVLKAIRDRRLENSTLVSSFNPLALRAFKRLAPDIATAVIWCDDEELPSWLRRGQGRWISGCDVLKPAHAKATPLSLALLSRLGGRPMLPWTVDDPMLARLLVARGCVGVVTNRPQDIVGALG